MSDAASTDAPGSGLVQAAARGVLPGWAEAGTERRDHIRRVAGLMGEWAAALGLDGAERDRWLAAAWLHDALRDAEPAALRPGLPPEYTEFTDPLLHGPAAAERLGDTVDPELADAIRYHTLGHPRFGRLGRALYLADFLEPGREPLGAWRASLRRRLPRELDAVAIEVVAARVRHLLERRKPIRPETAAFWSTLVGRRG